MRIMRWRVLTVCAFGILLAGSPGCRTQADAAAAAEQMEATAATLTTYYRALGHVVERTEDAVQAESALNGFGPVDQVETSTLAETRRQLLLRAQMAREIERLSAGFGRIALSSASQDASIAAGNLDAELVAVKAMGSNDAETKALTVGVKAIVQLIQQHEEVKAAKQMAPLCHSLAAFFSSERDLYDSLDEAYLRLARSDAKTLVNTGQVHASSVFEAAVRPFGLEAEITDAKTREGMKPYLLAQIERRFAVQLQGGKDATGYLGDGLEEMARRVDLVAADKPMHLREQPPTLQEVVDWARDLMD